MVQIKNDEIIRVQQSGLIGSKIDAEALKNASASVTCTTVPDCWTHNKR